MPRHALLNGLVLREADQRLMLAFSDGDAPFGRFDHARIDAIAQNGTDALHADKTLVLDAFREGGLAFKIALHFCLGGKAPRGITFQRFLNNRRQRLIAHQQIAMRFYALVFIANGRIERPISRLDTGAGLLDGLPPVLFPLQLPMRRHDRFHKTTFGAFLEFEVQTGNLRPPPIKFTAQLDIEFGIAGKALEIIEDDNERR